MSNISEIDSNFAIETTLNLEDVKFYTPNHESISLYGVFYENGLYRRLPEDIAKSTNEGVYNLHTHTAGGRVKFITDSPYIAIKSIMPDIGKMPHFALTGSAGFDLYVGEKEEYYNTFIPPYDITNGYESAIFFNDSKKREITINFPLYSSISALYIGLKTNSSLEKSKGYAYNKPFVFYGSSITQGGCASRPGTSYESIVSRALQADYINLGFSGSARAEDEIADYISTLKMSAFIYDYDYNAPSVEHLKATHRRMFSKIRSNNPDLPIIILSRPEFSLNDEGKQRLEIIKATYTEALEADDKNTYFISGPELMSLIQNEGTVDGCHPNDAGFYSMAQALIKQLKAIFN